jgi:BMFP domain-containing protein YqiC
MQSFKGLDDLVGRLSASMPSSIKHLQADIEDNIRSGLESGLQKMQLVTREEFDIQTAVLLKTRQKIDALEQRVQLLEQHLDIPLKSDTSSVPFDSSVKTDTQSEQSNSPLNTATKMDTPAQQSEQSNKPSD